ncbi:hypothetical protein TNIN_227641 [Trichonephila inaurata madagascariensis]|uniref:Uncharacterized protein n=1 Tax=Trichonephila inaurata madagascariensis TaxID=2747483 RepID=A0A8X6YC43_9ARAC|nr:hypothetical protein TNIN_227641 [Trichonephila inaurata madagascariensis]
MDDSDIWASQIINEIFENYQVAKHQANKEVSDVLLQDSASSEIVNCNIVKDKEDGELSLKDSKSEENISKSSSHSILEQESEVTDVNKNANESSAIQETFKVSEHHENLILPNVPSWLSNTYIPRLQLYESSSPSVTPSISTKDSNDNISFGESRCYNEAVIISYNADAEKTITHRGNAAQNDNNSLGDEFIIQKSKEIEVNNNLNTCAQREQTFDRNELAENLFTSEAPICKTLSPITMPVMSILIPKQDHDVEHKKTKDNNETTSNLFGSMEKENCRITEDSLTDKLMVQTSKDVDINNYLSQCTPTENASKEIEHAKDLLSSEVPMSETMPPFISPLFSSFAHEPNDNIIHEEFNYSDKTTTNSSNQILIEEFYQSRDTFEDNLLCSNLLKSVVSNEQLNRNHTETPIVNTLDSKDPSTSLQFTTNNDSTIKSVLQLENKIQEALDSHLSTDFVAALTLALTNGIETVASNNNKQKVAEKTVILREANTLPKKETKNPYRDLNLATGKIITSPRDRNIIVQSYRMLVTFIEICLIIPIATYLEKYLDLFEFILALMACIIHDSFCSIKSNAQNAFLSDGHLIAKEDNTGTAIKTRKYDENDNVEQYIETYNVPSFKSKTSKSSMSLIAFSSDTSSLPEETNELISLADDKSTKSCCEGSIDKIVGDVGISTFEMKVPNNMSHVNQLSHPLFAVFNESTTTEWNEDSVNKKETFERSFSISPMKEISTNIDFLSKGIETGTLKPSPMLKEYFKKIEELGTRSNILGNTKISIEEGSYFSNFDSLLELECIKKVESETDSRNFLSHAGEFDKTQNIDIDFNPENRETSLKVLNDELNVNILKQEALILNITEKNNENILLEIKKPHVKEEISSETKEDGVNRTLVANIFPTLQSIDTTEDTEEDKYFLNGDFIPFRNLEISLKENEETDNSEMVSDLKADEINPYGSSFGVGNDDMIFESFGKKSTTEEAEQHELCLEKNELDFDQNIDKSALNENITEMVTIDKMEDSFEEKFDSHNFLSNVGEFNNIQKNDIDFKPENREISLKDLNDELNVDILKQEALTLSKTEKDNKNILFEIKMPHIKEEISETKEDGENKTLVENIFPALPSIDTTEDTEEDKYLLDGDFIPFRNLEISLNENEETDNREVVSDLKTDEINPYGNSFGVGNDYRIFESFDKEPTTEEAEQYELCSEENELDFDQNIDKSGLNENITENVTIDKKENSFGEKFDPFHSINKSTETDSITESYSVLEDFATFAKIQNENLDDKARNKNNTVSLPSLTVQTSECIADENQGESNKLRNFDMTLIPNNSNETELNISISNVFNNRSSNSACLVTNKSYSIEDIVQKENDGKVTKYMSEEGHPFLQSVNSYIGSDTPEKNVMFEADFSPSRELENTFTSYEYKSNNISLPEAIESEQIEISKKLDWENKDDAFVNIGNTLTVKIANQDKIDSKAIKLDMDEGISNFANNKVSKLYFSEEFIPRVNYTEFEKQNEIKEIRVPKECQENINNNSNEFLIDIGCKRDVLLDHDCLELNEIENLKEKDIATFLEQCHEETGSKNMYTDNDLFDNVTYDQTYSHNNVQANNIKQIESEFSTQANDCSETSGENENEISSFQGYFTEITHLDTKKETANESENCSRNIILDESIATCCGYDQEESLEISQEMGDGKCSTINISLEVNCSLESIECLSSDDDDEENDFLESVKTNNGTKVYQSISGYISLENSIDTEMESFYYQEDTGNVTLLDEEPLLESKRAALASATDIERSNEDEMQSTSLSVPQFKSSESKHSQSSKNIPNVSSSQVRDSVKIEVPQSSEPFELDRPSENNALATTVEQPKESKSTSDIKKKKQGNIKHRVSSVWKMFQRVDKGHKYKKYHDDT